MKTGTAWIVFIVSGFLTGIGYVIPQLSIQGYTIGQVNAICNSGVGEFAQAVSSSNAQSCNDASLAMQAHTVLMIGGLIVLIITGVYLYRTRNKRVIPLHSGFNGVGNPMYGDRGMHPSSMDDPRFTTQEKENYFDTQARNDATRIYPL